MPINTRLFIRRISVLLISLLIFLLSVLCLFGNTFIKRFAYYIGDGLHVAVPDGEPGENVNVTMGPHVNYFFIFSFLAIALAVSLTVILFFWNKTVNEWKIKLVTIVFMVLLLILSLVNFSWEDSLWRIELQVFLDYTNVFLGLVVLQYLLQIRPSSPHGKALLWMTFFLVCLFGIILPFALGTIYLLLRFGIATDNINEKWITVPATVVSLLISWLTYQQKKRRVSE